MRETSGNQKVILARFQKWADQFDREFFGGFFSDKPVRIVIPKREKLFTKWDKRDMNLAYASVDDWEIGIHPECLKYSTVAELKDSLLHEMIHMWIFACHPRGRQVWGDRCQVFKHWSIVFHCPIKGRHVQDMDTNEFWICVVCGAYGEGNPDNPAFCPTCNSHHIKHYASRRCGRHL